MALHREDLTPEQLARQEAYDRSWAVQRRMMADPEFVAFLKARMRRIEEDLPRSPRITGAQFLAMTADLIE